MMSWTRLIVCIAILTESNTAQSNSTASMHPSKSSTEAGIPSANLTSDATARVVDGGMIGVGGGAINEKTRYYQPNNNTSGSGKGIIEGWNPSNNLGHMLHALVGLDRYPNYLGRFRDISDIDLLENALESKLSDVRRQRSEIIQKRVDIQQLVKRYTSSMTEFVEVSDDCPCSALWRDHPLLSPPKTWAELRERKMLTDHAFKVVHHSLLSIRNARTAKSNKTAKADTKDESIELHSVGDIIDGRVQVQLTQSSLEDFMCQEMFDVYSFPLLTHEVCPQQRIVYSQYVPTSHFNACSVLHPPPCHDTKFINTCRIRRICAFTVRSPPDGS
jgi:hypothetical protein